MDSWETWGQDGQVFQGLQGSGDPLHPATGGEAWSLVSPSGEANLSAGYSLGEDQREDPEGTILHLFQRLSVGLQKGNTTLIQSRILVFSP